MVSTTGRYPTVGEKLNGKTGVHGFPLRMAVYTYIYYSSNCNSMCLNNATGTYPQTGSDRKRR